MSIQNNCLNTYSMNKCLKDLVYASIEWVNPVAVFMLTSRLRFLCTRKKRKEKKPEKSAEEEDKESVSSR